jgi:hypothetical protein
MAVKCLPHDLISGSGLAQIESKRERLCTLCAYFRGRTLQRFSGARDDDYGGEIARQTNGRRAANAAAGTGHDCNRLAHFRCP